MNFISRFIFFKKIHYSLMWSHIKLNFRLKWDKFINFKKCGCGHPKWMHTCYEHLSCDHGVCLAETFTWGEEICDCDDFSDTTSRIKHEKFLESKN